MRGTPFLFEGFTGGLNTIDSPYTLDEKETRDCLNVVSAERGSILKRNGCVQFVTKSLPEEELTSVAAVETSTGVWYLIAAGGKNLYSINVAGEVSTIGEGFTEGQPWEVVQAPVSKEVAAEGPFYLTNGVDKTQYWTAAEKATKVKEWTGKEGEDSEKRATYEKAPHVPQGKYMVFAGNRIWMTGVGGDTSAVWFSEVLPIGEGGSQADPSDWPKTNVVRFDASDGKPITGIGTVGPYVLVFKETKIWVIHNINTGENRKIADKVGCVAQRSIVETTSGTFFLTADQGVYLTDGSKLHEMSYNIRPTLLAINQGKRRIAAGGYYNNHYYLSFPAGESNTNNKTLDYDVVLKSWWLHDFAANQWVIGKNSASHATFEAATAKAKGGVAEAFQAGVYTDLGKNYTGNGELGAWWLSPWQPFAYYIFRHRIKAPFLKKRVRQIFFDGEGEIIPIVYKNFHLGGRQEPSVVGNREISTQDELPTNFASSEESFGEGTGTFGGEGIYGGESTVEAARIYAPGVGRTWSIGWGNNSAAKFEINAYGLMIQFRKS